MGQLQDPGEALMADTIERLGQPADAIARWNRGLTWHPAGLSQHIWAAPIDPESAQPVWRVHIVTWCLKGVTGTPAQMTALAAELGETTLGALVRKPGHASRLGFAASLTAAPDHESWTGSVVAAIARLHVHDAIRLTSSSRLTATGVTRERAADRPGAPPSVQPAAPPDPVDRDLLPAPPLDALPYPELAVMLRGLPGTRAVATHSSVTATLPLTGGDRREQVILLELRPARRPHIGSGLSLSLRLPPSTPPHLPVALILNESELAALDATDLLGGWIVQEGGLAHEAFVPEALCSGPFIRHLVAVAAERAAWFRDVGVSLAVRAELPDEPSARILPFRRSP
jgi:hypothetical protein